MSRKKRRLGIEYFHWTRKKSKTKRLLFQYFATAKCAHFLSFKKVSTDILLEEKTCDAYGPFFTFLFTKWIRMYMYQFVRNKPS